MILTHTVTPAEEGMTLEALLRGPMALSGRQAREAKRERRVAVDGAAMFANQRVRAGQVVRVELGEYAQSMDISGDRVDPEHSADGSDCGAQGEEAQAPEGQSSVTPFSPVRVLYEDDALIAVHKPALLQCHPSPSAPGGSDTLESRVSRHLGRAVHPVHRLDAETSGIVLFAKLPYAQAHLQRQMQAGTFLKTYRAWVFGVPSPETGEIDAPIARLTPDSFTRVVRADGQRAVSRYKGIESRDFLGDHRLASLVELSPLTGRTHQLRVHMAHIGCPLLGDARYANEPSAALSLALGLSHHLLAAVALRFIHPVTGERVAVRCPAEFGL